MRNELAYSMTQLYYTPPEDRSFMDMQSAAMEIWGQYKNSPGDYYKEKTDRIRTLKNVGDNFMYMFAMFDMSNQRKVVEKLDDRTKYELFERLVDGGNDEAYIKAIGL